jgi:uncharacterized coiled-coil protein SlyX
MEEIEVQIDEVLNGYKQQIAAQADTIAELSARLQATLRKLASVTEEVAEDDNPGEAEDD